VCRVPESSGWGAETATFLFASTVDASCRVRDRLKAGQWNRFVASFTVSTNPFPETVQSILDLIQFPAFDLDQLAAYFILSSVHGHVHDIATILRKALQEAHIAVEGFADRFPAQ
jgi:hypothetical protein